MELIIGIVLIFWGLLILYSSLFRMKKTDYKDHGVSGFIVWDLLFRILGIFPTGVYKGFVILVGVVLIVLGILILKK